MQQSRGRFLAIQGFLALVVNLAINAAAGWVLFGARDGMPLTGDTSIAGDTIVGSFLIGLLTARIVAPAARREVRAGHVVGGGAASGGWLPGWIARRPWGSALVIGLVIAAVCGGGTVAALAALGIDGMSIAGFLEFKVAFAGAVGSVLAVIVAAIAIAGEDEPAEDPRWCREPDADTGGPSYPCDFIDKGGVVVTSEAHGCSATPTWQLVVSGALEPAAVKAAVGDLMVRYPSLRTRVQCLDARPEYGKRFRYGFDPGIEVDDIFEVVDLRGEGAGAVDRLAAEVINRHLDPLTEPPVTVTLAITGPRACRLMFRQHHAIADGRAFIELLTDFAAYLDARNRGEAPAAADLEPIHRVPELDALGLPRWTRTRYAIAGFVHLAGAVLKGITRPTTPLVHNDSNDYTGANGTVHWVVDDAAVDGWRAAQKRIGASSNSILTAALFLANQRWHRELGRPLGRTNGTLMMETRPRDGSVRSFANHLATLEVELPLGRDLDPAKAAQMIQAQVARQRDTARPIKRQMFERMMVLGLPVDAMTPLVFESKRPSYNVNFSNLIALSFPELGGDGWQVDEVLITTPVTPRNGLVVTVIRYRGRVCFNVNYTATACTAEQARTFARHFRDLIEEMTGHTAVELDTAAADHLGPAAEASYSQLVAPSA